MSDNRAGRPTPTDGGQAAVELALALPVVIVVVLGIVQVAAIVGDQLAVELAAREGARAAAVAADPASAATAAAGRATGLEPIEVHTTATAARVTVTVRHHARTDAPLIGGFIGEVVVEAQASMAREPP